MTKVNFYDSINDSMLKFAVIIARHNGKWVFCKHKERNTWEAPGGHREDGEDILDIFQNVAHKLDIQDAVEKGILSPVRCIRIKTNIDLRDVRYNGFKYNNLEHPFRRN